MTAGQDGFVTPAFVGVVGLTMVLLVVVANVLVVRWGEGALQAGVEAGARRAVATGSADECIARVQQAWDGTVGSLATQVTPPVCVLGPEGVEVTTEARFDGWVPLVGSHSSTATARAARAPAGS